MSSIGRHEEEFARSLARITENDPTFTGVNFADWGIGDEGAGRLIAALETNTVVKHLDLRDDGLSGAVVTALMEMLKNRTTSLEVLILDGNDIGVLGAVAVASFLRNKSRLRWDISSITHLYMQNCGICVKGARALAEALPSNSTLTHLHLGRNSLGDEGASLLAGALPGHLSLVFLYLDDNGIGDAGAMSLAEALPDNLSLTCLDLEGNDISDVGGRLLAKSLLVNCSVNVVVFAGNNISRALMRLVDELALINRGELGLTNDETSTPQETLELKFVWLRDLDKGDLRLLGFEESEVEEEILRLKIVCKVVWLIDSGVDGEKAEAVALVLAQLEHFMRADQRRGIFWRLLGSNNHGKDVANSVDGTMARTLYRYAAQCGAAPGVLMNILRAHESLCTCRDVTHKLYPFMLLATMTEAGVEDVIEVLKKDPTLVKSGICQNVAKNKRKRGSSTG